MIEAVRAASMFVTLTMSTRWDKSQDFPSTIRIIFRASVVSPALGLAAIGVKSGLSLCGTLLRAPFNSGVVCPALFA